ncbi:hypothetical protein E2C01_000736 [Portunus trituberculatus]|uniref:Uncharacterized protein n=1 Tax=Portunus trituberculatus TaxID=210409 RepID=A0A5B7CFW4_PORTR|nr:hypothetical protein [Portunus trituberculatus]
MGVGWGLKPGQSFSPICLGGLVTEGTAGRMTGAGGSLYLKVGRRRDDLSWGDPESAGESWSDPESSGGSWILRVAVVSGVAMRAVVRPGMVLRVTVGPGVAMRAVVRPGMVLRVAVSPGVALRVPLSHGMALRLAEDLGVSLKVVVGPGKALRA